MVRVTGFEPAAVPRKRRHSRAAIINGDAAGSTSHFKIKNMRHQWHLIFFGPSDRIRTCGILLPKQARYQLRYTRSSEWACSAPPPDIGFAGIRRLRIRAPTLPLRIKPASLGFDSVIFYPQGLFL